MKKCKSFKKMSAFIISAAMLASNLSVFAAYPQPTVNDNGQTVYGIIGDNNGVGYPGKIGQTSSAAGGDQAFKDRWLTTVNGKNAINGYSNAEKRFTVDGKNFILLDTDEDGNYFIIADDLYGKKAYTDQGIGTDLSEGGWNDIMYKGTWVYNPENPKSVANWLNNAFLTTGNVQGGETYKLPDKIISNLVEKDWWVEGGSKIEDKTFYKKYDAEAPLYTSIPSYKITQKVSLLSVTEYFEYWWDVSPLVYGGDNSLTGWSDNAWLLRTPNNIALDKADEKNQLALYINACNSGGSGMRATSTVYNAIGIRPVFWLKSDFFGTQKLDKLDKGATSIVNELKKCSPLELLDIYTEEELASVGIYFVSDSKVSDVYIYGQPIAGNKIIAKYTAEATSTKTEWLRSSTEDGTYEVVAEGDELEVKDAYAGYMKVRVTPYNTDGTVGVPAYSPAFEVRTAGRYPYTVANKDFPNDTTNYPLYNSVKNTFTIDTAQNLKDFIILDKVYGADGKPQLFIYSSHAMANPVSWATGVAGVENETASQKFDPTLEGSLAYKLNDNTATSSGSIDSSMWRYVKEHNWLTEAGLEDVCPESYFAKSKAAPLSYSEYMTYKTKIGSLGLNSENDTYSSSVSGNVYLRTPHNVKSSGGKQQVIRLTTNGGKTMTRFALTENLKSWSIGVRPAMYLDMDYFKNIRINLDATVADSALYAELAKHFTRENLIEIYPVEQELDKIGVVSKNDMPKVTDLAINGTLAVDSTVTADYAFDGNEGATKYQWYAMGASGVFEPIAGATSKSLKLSANEMGREILVAVQPADAEGNNGIETAIYTAEAVRGKVKTFVNPSASMTDDSISVTFNVSSDEETTGVMVIAVYDAGGVMVDLKTEPVQIAEGLNSYSGSFDGYNTLGVRCKAMIWKSFESMEPFGTFIEAAK